VSLHQDKDVLVFCDACAAAHGHLTAAESRSCNTAMLSTAATNDVANYVLVNDVNR